MLLFKKKKVIFIAAHNMRNKRVNNLKFVYWWSNSRKPENLISIQGHSLKYLVVLFSVILYLIEPIPVIGISCKNMYKDMHYTIYCNILVYYT